MKNLALIAAILLAFAAAGCNPGGETGDPNVGASTAPAESSIGKRPGTPGAPAPPPAPVRDPLNGRQ